MIEKGFALVGKNPQFLKAVETAKGLSQNNLPTLIQGEIGSGKKHLAEFIHLASSRKESTFTVVDCSQEPKSVENQILGYRDPSGKFHRGVLETCNGGTIVFENVDALEEKFQKRLHTILTELVDYDLDLRLIATTSKNLSKFAGAGRFNRALYIFFSKHSISIPALRDRKEDLNEFCQYFAYSYCVMNNIASVVIAEEAFEKLSEYYWTHNLKELKRVIEGAIQNARGGRIDIAAIKLGEKKAESSLNENDDDGIRLMSLKEAEQLLIKKALIHTSENRTQAAKILGVSIRTLRNKINEYRAGGSKYFVNLR